MATEDELRQTRLNKAERLRDLGVRPYPNTWRTNPELEDKRRRVVLLAADEEACAKLPLEDELTDDAPHLPLFGRVVAKRGPFLVIRTPHGDNHDMWVDPLDPSRLMIGNDIGVMTTTTPGRQWNTVRLPIGQMYHVSTDNRIPYYVYGQMQDDGSTRGPSNSPGGRGIHPGRGLPSLQSIPTGVSVR